MKDVVVNCEDLAFSYEDVPVLEKVNFHLHRGEFIALVGPNGAGKSTLLKLLLGLLKPQQGRLTILGKPVGEQQRLIGYVPQQSEYDRSFPIRVREVIAMGRHWGLSRTWTAHDDEAVQWAVDQVDVRDLLDRHYAALSGGQRRRVLVARALASRPELLVLDEPTANMDGESEKRLFTTLGNLKGTTTILIVTHDSEFVSSLTDRVLCVGERNETSGACRVVEHRTRETPHAPPDRFGGKALEVLHDETLPEKSCCTNEETP
ncbi:MAG: metal ABC transporter ATP-binding protein [Breznakiellaceae bacterium]